MGWRSYLLQGMAHCNGLVLKGYGWFGSTSGFGAGFVQDGVLLGLGQQFLHKKNSFRDQSWQEQPQKPSVPAGNDGLLGEDRPRGECVPQRVRPPDSSVALCYRYCEK